jgi:peptidoglycan/LPS O-acetylase OafA/YrhL
MSSTSPTTSTHSASAGDPQNPGGFTHIPALDGVRGLAILLVLFVHLFTANDETGHWFFDGVNHIIGSFYIGVNLFFVLSGFLITGILLDTLHQPHFFKTFYVRRALRIFPLYYGVLFLLLLFTRPLHFVWSGWQYFYLTYTANLALSYAHPLILGSFDINHFWSLQVEEQFYLVWPFLVYGIRRLRSLIRLSLIACAAILTIRIVLVLLRPHLQNIYLPYSPTFSCADNLLFGCGLCCLLRTSARQRVLDLAPRLFAVGAAILVCAGIYYRGLIWQTNFFIPTFGFTLIGITFAALVAMALRPRSKTQHLFENRTLRFFGKYSYGLYVFHYSVDGFLTRPTRLFVNNHLHSKALAVLAGACLVTAVTIPIALLSYNFYEAPFLKLKRYFSYNRSATRLPARPRETLVTEEALPPRQI